MSGHSKWATIKHKKAAVDARRGKIFTKLIRELTSAARMGGGDPDANPRLRTAVAAAKSANMPSDTIQRAIKKGTGELPGEVYEEVTYEGYGAGGVAILVDVLTDNKNRTVAEIRHLFSKHGGSLGESGCVAWMFARKGLITLAANQIDEDALLEIVLEAGGDDVKVEADTYEIVTAPEAFDNVRSALEQRGLTPEVAEITMIPQNTVPVEGKQAEQVLRLMEALDDQDDVRKAHANFDISEEVMAAIAS
ncbi:MAG: YebC/PmpR family DNA-binding transcriptional regulator [candidate division KSB1 bacterium]|nr:YebC/PmpR family DNA-binding transcriptional regulator [candidate division KSB1 bacterium]